MRLSFRAYALFAALLSCGALWGQEAAPDHLIVQLGADVDAKVWLRKQADVREFKLISAPLNAWLLYLDHHKRAPASLVTALATDPAVRHAQLDHRLSLRRRPDDPLYERQWQLRSDGHNLEAAWAHTTGGVTAAGDTIVIASIDSGVDIGHEDLVDNFWINRNEIPDNDIDDDGNGYIDDVYGWNTALDNNDVAGSDGGAHGTPVAGQMAARGNNGLGVTGINWFAKVMHITNDFDPLESEVLQAYGYALEARRRYDATGGREGAYVVATNASWGRERAFPSQSPLWCALYDTLGSHGILNVAAVPNRTGDVDVTGDLPSLCTSDYLVVVTSLDRDDGLAGDAATGPISVDLGAYGEDVYTTLAEGRYGRISGTSFAAPAVTGALALLHTAPCESLNRLLRSDPGTGARVLRDAVLQNVRPVASLEGRTTTGGVLDVGRAMESLVEGCPACLPPTSFTARAATDGGTDLLLDWRATSAVTLRYRALPGGKWQEVSAPTPPYRLSGLPGCSNYALQLRTDCAGGTVATDTLYVETPGCCRLPEEFAVRPLSGGRIAASWAAQLTAVSYTLRYRSGESGPWTEMTTPDTDFELTGLRSCRNYTLELRTNCGETSRTDFGLRRSSKTLGCGICLDAAYCLPTDYGNEQEWIAEVDMPGVLSSTSGRESDGYANFGDLTTAGVVRGGVYPVRLTAGFRGGGGFTEDFHVYVDWDQDGNFSEAELTLQADGPGEGGARGSITVPEEALPGLTRMRVIMQFNSVSTDACAGGRTGRQLSGEVEDYCLDVVAARGCPPPATLTATYDTIANATFLSWPAAAAPGGSYHLRYRDINEENYTELTVDDIEVTVADLNLCDRYELQIASICGEEAGDYHTVRLGDNCVRTHSSATVDPAAWSVSPNPADGWTKVRWSRTLTVSELALYAADGRRFRRHAFAEGASPREWLLSTYDLPAGVYALHLRTRKGKQGVRRLVVR